MQENDPVYIPAMSMVFSTAALRKLATAYMAHHRRVGARTLAERITGGSNNKLLLGILANSGTCNLTGAERATEWFLANWPVDLPWPDGVPMGPRPHRDDAEFNSVHEVTV